MDTLVSELRAISEPTRLRVMALLAHGELSVGELVQILGQSQPRLSRHLKFLTAAGLVDRMPEGAWVFYRIAAKGRGRDLADAILSFLSLDDPDVVRDLERLEAARSERRAAADAYFSAVAGEWDQVRALQFPEADVENAIRDAAGAGPFRFHVDVGTGTGRMLGLLSDLATRSEGLDLSHQMLTVARANLDQNGVRTATVRFSDAAAMPYSDGEADLVTIHQVLHYLDQPGRVVAEAARVLAPGGRLLIVDFAPHSLEFLRSEQQHRYLGFRDDQVSDWLTKAGMTVHPPQGFDAPRENGLAVRIWTADKLSQIKGLAA